MAKLNKTCTVCGTKYSYCPVCSADASKPTWMNMFCSENCKDLFQTATDYYAGELTKEQAKRVVVKADLTNKENFKPSIVRMIEELEDVKPAPEVVEEVKVEEVKEEKVEEKEEVVEEATEEKVEAPEEDNEKKYRKRYKK